MNDASTTEQPAVTNLCGAKKMLLLFIDEDDRYEHMHLYEAILRRLLKFNISGATVLRGIMGFGAQHRIYGPGTLGIPDSRPITILIIEEESKLKSILPEIESMIREGLVVLLDAFVQKHITERSPAIT